VDRPAQRPLELILARNLLSSLFTPAFLVNRPGDMIFFNGAAGALLGRTFEETGPMSAQDWLETFGPFDAQGDPIPIEDQPLTPALRANRAAHSRHRIRSLGGREHDVEVTGLPIIGADGFHGAMVFFWTTAEAGA
jgi:PAS domain-containing protein